MRDTLNELLKHKAMNGWNLFWLIAAPVSLAIVLNMARVDLASAEGVSAMIQLSVRCAVPLLFVAFAASSLQVLFPGSFSRWLLRNRKFIGLSFATAMGWQLTFILWLVGIHTDYYVNDVYVFTDVVEGVIGYVLLLAMVVTSFKFGRSRLTPGQWKMLHKTAIYWIWFYAWSTYWFGLFYYQSAPVLLDYLYYWGGFVAWYLRLSAWTRKSSTSDTRQNVMFVVPGVAAIVIGLIGAGIGRAWSPQVYEYLFGFGIIEYLDTFTPYFPFVPLYPIFLIMLGSWLVVRSKG